MRVAIQVAAERDLNLLVGYLALQLGLGELTVPGEAPRVCTLTGLPAKWWAQPELGCPDKKSSNPPDASPGAHLGDGDVVAATAGA